MEITKNKKLTYFLIGAVAIVWGIILHRIFFTTSDEDYMGKRTSNVVKLDPYDQYVLKEDTFKLALNYRDPFLGQAEFAATSKVEEVVVKQANFVPTAAPKPLVDWTVIKYSGYIINPINKAVVSIITVNGVERMLTEGEIFEGAQLLKNKRDSVLISWKGKQKYIKQ